MTDPVTTIGRQMTRGLEQALDDLGAAERKRAIVALREGAATTTNPHMGRLYQAIAVELQLVALRENYLMHRVAVEMIDQPDDDICGIA